MKRLGVIIAIATLLPLAVSAQHAPGEGECQALRGLSLPPDAIALPSGGADVATAEIVEAGIAYCRLTGAIDPVDPAAPDINFQINLPLDWNGKGLHFGGAGYNGQLVTGTDQARFNPDDAPTPLQRGYATWGSDSGHQATSRLDGRFLMNEEALRNFGGDQLKKTYDVATAAIGTFYGRQSERVYFQGNSQGGHEGMIATQRWPDDYDGAIVVHPANSFVGLQLSGNLAGQALYRQNAWLDPSDVELLNGAVMEACDGLDGASDELVADIAGCAEAFDVTALRCESGMPDHGTCLGDAQIKALKTIDTRIETPPLQGGAQGFAGWPIFLGADLYGLWGMGKTATPSVPPAPVANFGLAVLADPMIRFAILRDPSADTLEFDQFKHAVRISEVSELTDAVSPDMRPFADKGGKILLLHGTTDFAIPFGNSVDWYERVVAEMGRDETSDFMRFWLVPGFGHGSGKFQLRWNSLEALENWVENGVAPEGLVASDVAKATAGRTRPLCEYPSFARMKEGANDMNVATSFTCVEK